MRLLSPYCTCWTYAGNCWIAGSFAMASFTSPNGALPTSALMLTLRWRSKRVICTEPLAISSVTVLPLVGCYAANSHRCS